MSGVGEDEERSFRHAIGPGILFAGAAVGVSHLVQSTRAGASYGLSLVGVILLANLVKYPAFRLGPQYAASSNVEHAHLLMQVARKYATSEAAYSAILRGARESLMID